MARPGATPSNQDAMSIERYLFGGAYEAYNPGLGQGILECRRACLQQESRRLDHDSLRY